MSASLEHEIPLTLKVAACACSSWRTTTGPRAILSGGLSESLHVVDHARDGETGLALPSEDIYDALIVDRRLPPDGPISSRRLRERDTVALVLC